MSYSTQVIVIGAGVVGLACARRFAMEGYETLVLDSEATFGTGISARSSEVIHAGIYYPHGSFKARLCIDGREQLYSYCRARGVPHRQIGKWIVASDESQLPELASIRQAAHRNGCAEVDWVDASLLRRQAPALRCTAALYSPRTGIIDSHVLMQNLVADIETFGGVVAYRSAVSEIRIRTRGAFSVHLVGAEDTIISAQIVINAAGLAAPKLAASIDGLAASIPTAAYAKGSYFAYTGRVPFPHLVYPVPEKGGLGVHLTFDLQGCARFGPDVEWVDSPHYTVDSSRRDKFVESIRRYWPDVNPDKLHPAYAGVRPKLGSRESFEKDFVIHDEKAHQIQGLWNLLGIESPGLTASLALADYVFSTHQKS